MKVHQLLEGEKKEIGVQLEAKVKRELNAAIKEFEVPDLGRFTCSPYPGHGGNFKVDIACFSDALDPAEIADLHDDPEIRKKLKAKVDAARSRRMENIVDARKKIFKKVLDFAIANGVKEIGVGTGRKEYVAPQDVDFDDVSWSGQEVRFSLMFPHELRGKTFNLVAEREKVYKLLVDDKELKKKYVVEYGRVLLNTATLKAFIEQHKEQVDADIEHYIRVENEDAKARPGLHGPATPEERAKRTRAYYNYNKLTPQTVGSLRCLTQYLVIQEMGKEVLADIKAALARIDHLTAAKIGAKLEQQRPIWLHHHDHTIVNITVGKPKFEKENYKGG